MKKTFVIVSALVIAGTSSWAQNIAFPVKLKGVIAYAASSNAVVRVGVTDAGLVAPSNHLVLVVSLNFHTFLLEEVDSNTNVVQVLMTSRRLAILPDNTFAAGMQFSFSLPPQAGGFPEDGDIDISGKINAKNGVPKSISANISGVLNDSISGSVSNLDVTIKGKLTSAGAPFDGSGLIPE